MRIAADEHGLPSGAALPVTVSGAMTSRASLVSRSLGRHWPDWGCRLCRISHRWDRGAPWMAWRPSPLPRDRGWVAEFGWMRWGAVAARWKRQGPRVGMQCLRCDHCGTRVPPACSLEPLRQGAGVPLSAP